MKAKTKKNPRGKEENVIENRKNKREKETESRKEIFLGLP